MLGYVFWHHPAAGVDVAAYEESLAGFHRALAAGRPDGFLRSAAFAVGEVPWFPEQPAYLDWYAIDGFANLGTLNEGAIAGARKEPHDKAAKMAGGGSGGVFKLVAGWVSFETTNIGTWLKKPSGMGYNTFLEQISGWIDADSMGLWQRQMNLGPGLEFCLHSRRPVAAQRPSVRFRLGSGGCGVHWSKMKVV